MPKPSLPRLPRRPLSPPKKPSLPYPKEDLTPLLKGRHFLQRKTLLPPQPRIPPSAPTRPLPSSQEHLLSLKKTSLPRITSRTEFGRTGPVSEWLICWTKSDYRNVHVRLVHPDRWAHTFTQLSNPDSFDRHYRVSHPDRVLTQDLVAHYL